MNLTLRVTLRSRSLILKRALAIGYTVSPAGFKRELLDWLMR